MSKINQRKSVIAGALMLALAVPLVAGSASAENLSAFQMTASNIDNPKITATFGAAFESDGGGTVDPEPEVPEIPEAKAEFKFTINKAVGYPCNATPAGLYFRGVGAGTELVAPDGTRTALREGFNTADTTGQWAVEGTFTGIGDRAATVRNMGCITSVDEWGDTGTTDLTYAFYNGYNLKKIDKPESKITKIDYAFANVNAGFNQNMNDWDVDATTMMNVFSGASGWNNGSAAGASDNPLTWDMSKVTSTSWMFQGAQSFNQPVAQFNMSNVDTISGMFMSARRFNQPVNGWNTDKFVYVNDAFNAAIAFDQPLDKWNMSKVQQTSNMFAYMNYNRPLASWDMSNVDNIRGMFMGNSAFNQPIGSWKLPKVKMMSNVFQNATAFNQPIDSWNVQNPSFIDGMFDGASSFNQPLGSWNVENTTGTQNFLRDAVSFEQDLSNWKLHYTSSGSVSATDLESFASGAEKFTGNCALWPFISDGTGLFGGAVLEPCK